MSDFVCIYISCLTTYLLNPLVHFTYLLSLSSLVYVLNFLGEEEWSLVFNVFSFGHVNRIDR